MIVKDLSRFGRSFEETGHYLERVFPFLQVRFVAVNDNFDSLTATLDEKSLMVPLKNLVNEVFARDISKKVLSSFKAKQQRGEFCGAFACYGYIKEGQGLILDKVASEVVKQIYEWQLEGIGAQAIVKQLNNLKITPPNKHRFEKGITKSERHEKAPFWYISAVKRILSNPMYTGNLVQGRFKSTFPKGGRPTKTDKSEWIIINDTHPQIISEEDFEAVQELNKARGANFAGGSASNSDNIFRGILVCGDCGKHMARGGRQRKTSFTCYLYTISSQSCTKKTILETDLHDALYAFIKCEISLAVDMKRIIEDMQKQKSYQYHQSSVDKQISAIERKLKQNQRFRGALREDFKDGVFTEKDYITMRADYDDEKGNLQQSLTKLTTEKAKQKETLSPNNKWLAEFQRFESEKQLTSGMVSALIEQIKVYDNSRVEVSLRYRDELESLRGYVGRFDESAVITND